MADPRSAPAGISRSKAVTAVKSAASPCPVPPSPDTDTRTVVLEAKTAAPSGKEAVTRTVAAAAPSVTEDCTPVVSSSASTLRLMTVGEESPSVMVISTPFTVTVTPV